MSEKPWSKEFLEYEKFIANHPNYKGLPITIKDGKYGWIAPAKSEIGKKRKEWAENKGKEYGLINNFDGFYAAVMFIIHPTKKKPCQICGKEMSLFYIYPNVNLKKAIKKIFNYDCDKYDSIYDICKKLIKNKISEKILIHFLKDKFKLDDNYTDIETLITHCEHKCRNGYSKLLGPGAMSNFPDRYDGFHTYNRCCRSEEDKGRSKENLKTYGKDRRAYEYFSDGNIHAADRFMSSARFNNSSADHLIPVSLGGVHDPRFLQPISSGDNSSKRDRLIKEDILKAVEIENRTKIRAVSFFSIVLWDYLKDNVNLFTQHDLERFRKCLKQTMADYLTILYIIKNLDNNTGIDFITEKILRPKMVYFKNDYIFNKDGTYVEKARHITERASEEFERMKRISLEALDDYNKKENRNMNADFSIKEKNIIEQICRNVLAKSYDNAYALLEILMKEIQNRQLYFFINQRA